MKNSSRLPAPLFRLSVQNIKIAPPKTGFFGCFSCLFRAILYPLCQLLKTLLLINRQLHICITQHTTAFLLQMLAKRWFANVFGWFKGAQPSQKHVICCYVTPLGLIGGDLDAIFFGGLHPPLFYATPLGLKIIYFIKSPKGVTYISTGCSPVKLWKRCKCAPKYS